MLDDEILNTFNTFDDMSKSWDKRFMALAEFIASFSKDRSTQLGAVIVDDRNTVMALGWNGFPRGINDDIESRHERPIKYRYTEHAERNAIYNAAATGHALQGCRLYSRWLPCAACARAIIQSGIAEVISRSPELGHPRWGDEFIISLEMLSEAGISVKYLDGEEETDISQRRSSL